MGNGHAPGTEMGLGAAGTDAGVCGFGSARRREAGLAVFFFAAFFSAGFRAGFFLAATLRFADALRALDLRTVFRVSFFLRAELLFLADFFFAVFFFALAIIASNHLLSAHRRSQPGHSTPH